MKILYAALILLVCQAFVQLAAGNDGNSDENALDQCKSLLGNAEATDVMCEDIFEEITYSAKTWKGDEEEESRAQNLGLDCLRDTSLVEQLQNSETRYRREFANLQVTKARKYFESGSDNGFDGNNKNNIFIRLVPEELKAELEASDFPVADNSEDENKEKNLEAAYSVLRTACGVEGDAAASSWSQVKSSICTSNWDSTSSTTVQNIFTACLIDAYTKFALDDKQGYERVQKSSDTDQLKKRWMKVTEIIKTTGNYEERTEGLRNICLGGDTPDNVKDTLVFRRLRGIARQLAPSAGDDFCPNADLTSETLVPSGDFICYDGIAEGAPEDAIDYADGPDTVNPT